MSLSRNTAYTMGSALAQIGVTLATLPTYLSVIGLERYGVVVLVWLIYEYLLLFNLGMDRAAINFMSRNRHDSGSMTTLFWSAILVCVLTGTVGGIMAFDYLSRALLHPLSVAPQMIEELGWGIPAIAVTLVIGVSGTILAALLQAHERFLELNIAQLAMSIAFQVAPVVAATLISPKLETVIVAGCAARSIQTALYLAFCLRKRYRIGALSVSRVQMANMLRYGAWTSVSGVVSPIIVNLDRMLISALTGSAAVAIYAVPYNLVMKAQLIPTSLASALFPRLSQTGQLEERRRTAESAALSLAAALGLGLIVGSFLLEPFLAIWIKNFVSRDGVLVGQILILGIWFNGLAVVPFVLLQATGRPDTIAKIHVLELAPFALGLWFLVAHFGVVGAAWAWTARVVLDALVMSYVSDMLKTIVTRTMVPFVCVVGAISINSMHIKYPPTLAMSGIVLAATVIGWAYMSGPPQIRKLTARVLTRASFRKAPKG